MKKTHLLLPLLVVFGLLSNCSVNSTKPDPDAVYGQTGALQWHGSPAVDGLGMLFVIDEKTSLGVPGTREDYASYFGDENYEVEITADYKFTGKETVRGWGATYLEIEFLSIKVIE